MATDKAHRFATKAVHAGQHAEFVLDQDGDRVSHERSTDLGPGRGASVSAMPGQDLHDPVLPSQLQLLKTSLLELLVG